MNAIEIKNLSKSFHGMYAVDHLNMTVPAGSIYGFIGENGFGKFTTEKMICGLIPTSGGSIKSYGKDYTDAEKEVVKVLKMVRMEGAAGNKYKNLNKTLTFVCYDV